MLALSLAAGTLAGLGWLGRQAGGGLVGRDRYAIRTADLDCSAPPGSERTVFLSEVRYLAGLPETLSAVDPALLDTLTAAFAKHPWVKSVNGVTVSPDRRVHVDVTFRTPVLAVAVRGDEEKRVVDAAGVLLPATTSAAGLAELENKLLPPTVAAGQVWPDPDVTRAAELAAAYKAERIEKTDKGWRITATGGKVLVVGW